MKYADSGTVTATEVMRITVGAECRLVELDFELDMQADDNDHMSADEMASSMQIVFGGDGMSFGDVHVIAKNAAGRLFGANTNMAGAVRRALENLGDRQAFHTLGGE